MEQGYNFHGSIDGILQGDLQGMHTRHIGLGDFNVEGTPKPGGDTDAMIFGNSRKHPYTILNFGNQRPIQANAIASSNACEGNPWPDCFEGDEVHATHKPLLVEG